MRYVSAFSGIEAASVAWHPLGWQAVALIEFDAFPSEVLAHHYPNTPNLGDITKVTEDQVKGLGPVDVFVFGSPCQDLSVAGKRKGLDGERSGLFFDAMRLVRWLREHCGLRWAVWENVPGAFSSNEGRDFAAVVAALGGFEFVDVPPKGWGTEGAADGPQALVEWSTLDAQWFGVAQRRRRCFAVADFGDWTGRQPVLLEPDRLRGDSAPAPREGCASELCEAGGADAVAVGTWWDGGRVSQTLDAVLYKKQAMPEKNRFPAVMVPAWQQCDCCDDFICNIHIGQHVHDCDCPPIEDWVEVDAWPYAPNILRFITPRECERLQGFPDDYTLIPWRGKPADQCPDGPRYKALGNSMAVPVMRWIGRQIDFAHRFF